MCDATIQTDFHHRSLIIRCPYLQRKPEVTRWIGSRDVPKREFIKPLSHQLKAPSIAWRLSLSPPAPVHNAPNHIQ